MTDVSRQMLERDGIVAAADIWIATVCQASLTDFSQCRPASDAGLSVAVSGSAGYGDATRRSLSDRDSDGVRQACASSGSRAGRARRHARLLACGGNRQRRAIRAELTTTAPQLRRQAQPRSRLGDRKTTPG
jgi:hypothetical protein